MFRSVLLVLIAFFCVNSILGQTMNKVVVDSLLDTKYREDQFYLGATYNILVNKPESMVQSGFSIGVHAGFIRDFPLNKKRTFAMGIGFGLSTNSFNQNLGVLIDDKDANFTILNDANISFSRNRVQTHLIELPIEFRWRNSTPKTYKFWRVYSGFKMGYIFANSYTFQGEPNAVNYNNLDIFNDVQYGLTLSAGYHTWNIHLYYSLNPLFKGARLENNTAINVRVVKVGLLFYLF